MADKRICSVDGCGKPYRSRNYCNAHYQAFLKFGDALFRKGPANGEARSYLENVVIPYTGNDCLIWPFYRDENGYARIGDKGKTRTVCRVVCESIYGPPPHPKHEAAHECGHGHKGCVTPNHLNWKSRSENQADRLRHGTDNRGEKSPRAKLREWQVREIRENKTDTLNTLSKKYGVSETAIWSARNRETWFWLE